jgi:hypothetical protein
VLYCEPQGLQCAAGRCRACGTEGAPCCEEPGKKTCSGQATLVCSDAGICEACGRLGDRCCASSRSSSQPACVEDGDLVCNVRTFTCELCGKPGAPCCPSAQPCESSATVCSNGACAACGGAEQPCCGGQDSDIDGWCSDGALRCQATLRTAKPTCNALPCGGPDQPCCLGGTDLCPRGGTCDYAPPVHWCIDCGEEGQPCCDDGPYYRTTCKGSELECKDNFCSKKV